MGLLALFGGVALFSTVEVVTRLIGARVSPWQLVFARFFVTGLVLLALVGRNLPDRLAALRPRDYALFALNGLLGIAVAISLFQFAMLVFAKAASCAVVFSANPIFVMLLARFVNGEPWNRVKLAAVAAGAVGVVFFCLGIRRLRPAIVQGPGTDLRFGLVVCLEHLHFTPGDSPVWRVYSHGIYRLVRQPDGAAAGAVQPLADRAGGLGNRVAAGFVSGAGGNDFGLRFVLLRIASLHGVPGVHDVFSETGLGFHAGRPVAGRADQSFHGFRQPVYSVRAGDNRHVPRASGVKTAAANAGGERGNRLRNFPNYRLA